ncbi:MAG: glycine cleavage system protein H [Firmicutes bacterium]|nr:glycine cleavage system protein H [Bacillota bacterium]
MAQILACEFPDHLFYQVDYDVWLEPQADGTVRVGMTDPAQTRAGRILHVRVREGRRVAEGKSLATVESGKWVGPMPSPLPGRVVAKNPRLEEDPSLINRDPYGAGWVVGLQPDVEPDAWSRYGVVPAALALEPFRRRLEEAGISCLRCLDPGSPDPTVGEGG